MDLALMGDILITLLALITLEIILGIDNLVFISILSSRLPQTQQKFARRLGLFLALFTRLLLLACAVWLIHLTQPLFTIFEYGVSFRDLFLFFGGIFLLIKGGWEIYKEIYSVPRKGKKPKYAKFSLVVIQIALFDVIFSLDSILTAVSLTSQFAIMAAAITIAIIVMIMASEHIHYFIQQYPTVKMLALCFLMLIGVVLVADGLSIHIPRGYIYFALFFALMIETFNHIVHRKRKQSQTTGSL